MAENSNSGLTGPEQVEQEFAETLRQAAFIFQNEKNGRFQGSILACRAVARFIHQRGGAAELAGPFLQIAEAFKELERGGKPKLFSKKSVRDKERERSPERKHIQMLAAAALEVMVTLTPRGSNIWDDDKRKRDGAAAMIARHVNKWPGMGAQEVTGGTVIAWRNQQRALTKSARKPFDTVVEKILAEPNPQKTIDDLLRSGPPRALAELEIRSGIYLSDDRMSLRFSVTEGDAHDSKSEPRAPKAWDAQHCSSNS